ncbi:MAG: NAD-glutamate dehydrogenase [Marivibrio sp.]|uniref:NAD-glutamate dehydrogenase n=1 Tax=Marivibrio sp. TaxID=2039719 RepID=UPI0032EA98D6
MSDASDQRKAELLTKVRDLIDKRMPAEKAERARIFTDHYYRHTPPDDIADREAEDLYGAALSMWSFGQERPPGEPKIRVYNPRFEQHGWHSTHTVIELVNDNMPFLVDSVTMELARQGLTVHLVVHPIFGVERDAKGVAQDFPSVKADPSKLPRESFMHVEIDEQSDPAALKSVEEGLQAILSDVRAAVEDWARMREKAVEVVDALNKKPPKGVEPRTVAETAAFVQWLHDDHFTFMGYREIDFEGSGENAKLVIDESRGLGVLRDPQRQVFEGLRHLGALPAEVQQTMFEPRLVRITKANRRSTVHRRVHMDTVAIKRFDAKGNPVGERLFVGLLTSVAYNQSPREIPLLRQKVDAVIERSGFEPGGHSSKALMHILESYPRDELFQIEVDQLYDIAMGILHLQERQRIALFLRPDPFQRYVSALVYVPRDRFSTSLRKKIGRILAHELEGSVAANYTHMSDEALSRVQFIIKTTPGQVPDYDRRALEEKIREETRTWEDKLRQAMIENHGEERGLSLLRRYAEAFPLSYTEHFGVQTAAHDIERVEEALSSGRLGVSLYQPIETEKHQLRLKVYHPGGPMVLSAVMPMLENMGLKVMEEQPFDVRPARDSRRGAQEADQLYMHDFALETHGARPVDFHAVRDVFHDSFKRVWNGEIEDDGFNRLVLSAGLGWRDVVVLRAYSKYLRQAAIPFSQDYMEETLASNGAITRLIAELFTVRFDPAYEHDRAAREQEIVAEIEAALETVSNLDEDRIIRRFLNLVRVTLRTNFFQPDESGAEKTYISFKLSSREIDEIPQPAPLREIFVYSPRFEAVHLRFGLVARGGLRWSDRREDFRTEVLGLVKAQQVKNAVIVPVGSKGGFVLKKAPPASDREAFMKEGVACYRLFISGMLDITDNLAQGAVAPPDAVVRWDADDPYLVVAADKGTATFSDYANAVSQSYGFWLGDAFASGGSAGYDHKKMGITARGGWEAVKRHFREIGHDTQTQDFTVIGVGDMGGDVFGNGMLLSEHIRLVAAFNHLHIFIDPEPDAAKSFKERKRLFEAVKGWGEYDEKLISQGGAVFERSKKSLKLTPEIKARFGIEADELTPNQLIKAVLQGEADLLWFGGIGTYVKHSDESHGDVGDRANDAIRVNGEDLKVKVIGEGANLGITHRGRIEFAMQGGRINTDAIDNSAGVDCSDHEVNIKILLGDVVSRGDMTEKQRNRLLETMTDEVAALVLRDNYQQTQSISVTQARAADSLDRHQRLIRAYERAGDLDRQLEFLPDDEEIAERMQKKQGLTRPELAVLLAYAKNVTYQDLLESDLPDDSVLAEDLFRYFPQPLQTSYADAIEGHRLRREIIATSVTNSMINRTGPSFVNEMQQRTGQGAAAIARAYTVVRDVFDLRPLWREIEALDTKVTAALQNKMLRETGRTVERMTEWFLRNEARPIDIQGAIAAYKAGVKTLQENFEEILSDRAKQDIEMRKARFGQEDAVSDSLARSVAQLKVLSSACDVVRIAAAGEHPVKEVGRTYSGVGERFGLDWLRSSANRIPSDNQWHRMALGAIIDDLWSLQGDLTGRILAGAETGSAAIDGWVAERAEQVERIDALLSELDRLPQLDLAMLAVVTRELRTLTAAG